MTDEYEALSIGLDCLMSETSKKQLFTITKEEDKQTAEIIEIAFKAGWMMGINDCGIKTLNEYVEYKKKEQEK